MHLISRFRHRSRHNAAEKNGQTLVEFALVFPLFWLCVVALIEFAFMFNALLSVSTASRGAALVAIEAADAPTADCSILRTVEGSFRGPAFASQIQRVDIYRTDTNGVKQAGALSSYTRSGSAAMSCTVNGTTFTVPYNQTANGYPPSARCSTRIGCGSGHSGLDTIGVDITYLYPYHTPYGAVLGGSGMTFERSAEMRVEPFQ